MIGWFVGELTGLVRAKVEAHNLSKSTTSYCRRANMAHIRQSRPDSGLGFQIKVLNTFHMVLSPGSGGGVRCGQIGHFLGSLILTGMYHKYSGSMNVTTHMDHIGYCETASGTHWLNRWTYRVFIITTRRDSISLRLPRSTSLAHPVAFSPSPPPLPLALSVLLHLSPPTHLSVLSPLPLAHT